MKGIEDMERHSLMEIFQQLVFPCPSFSPLGPLRLHACPPTPICPPPVLCPLSFVPIPCPLCGTPSPLYFAGSVNCPSFPLILP